MWARFGVVAFSVCRHVGDVAHSTSHEPTRSGMEPDVKGTRWFSCVGAFGGRRMGMQAVTPERGWYKSSMRLCGGSAPNAIETANFY